MKMIVATSLIAVGMLSTAAVASPNTNFTGWADQAFQTAADRQ